jgi:ribosomal protein S27E
MKTAKTITAAVYVTCPECGEYVSEPMTGSLMFEPNDVKGLPAVITCSECGAKFKRPTMPRKAARS